MAIVLRVFLFLKFRAEKRASSWAGGASGVDGLKLSPGIFKAARLTVQVGQPAIITTPVRGKYSRATIPFRLSFTSTQSANRSAICVSP